MKTILTYLVLLISFCSQGQVSEDSELYRTLKARDSLVFDIGFNKCMTEVYDEIISEDLEFYHDSGGFTAGKVSFIENFKNGICARDNFRSRRELIRGSLLVYPLYQNGTLYGAIQTGRHRFFESYNNEPEIEGSIARFTHVWIIVGTSWKLKRVLSYDHKEQ